MNDLDIVIEYSLGDDDAPRQSGYYLDGAIYELPDQPDVFTSGGWGDLSWAHQ